MHRHCPTCRCHEHQQDPIDALIDECNKNGIRIRYPQRVSEGGAAFLLGLSSADTLRKQHSEGRGTLKFKLYGNRRMYSLADIADFIGLRDQ